MRPSTSILLTGVSAGAGVNSSAVWATDIIRCSYQVVVQSGAFNGTFRLQGSNDKPVGAPPIQFQPTNWYDISSASVVLASTSASLTVFACPPIEVCSEYLRVRYVNGSGDGTMAINFTAKAL